MITKEFKQLSPEWFEARAGRASASSFDKIITSIGKPSTQAKKYMYQLAGERITKKKEESYQNAAMTRGIELEPEARSLFEMVQEVEVQEVGLCYFDETETVSCSPDGLIGDDGGLEIKCPSLAVHVEYLIDGKLPTKYIQQVQGSMHVTGRFYWWFMSYYPGMPPLIIKIEKDIVFCSKLKTTLDHFVEGVDVLHNKLNNGCVKSLPDSNKKISND